MITIAKPALIAWGLAASLLASGNQRRLAEPVLDAMVDAALANPFTDSDDGVRTMLSYEVSLAWREGQNQLNPAGPNDGGASHCWGQIYLPNGARTREGWTGEELRHDPVKCATATVRIIKMSVSAGPVDCPLCFYARGRDTPEARRLSAHRVNLALRLLREVPLQ